MLTNKQYDVIKYLCCIGLPAIIAAILSLGTIYSWNWAETVAQTIGVFQVLLGSLFCISAASYKGDNTK